MPTTAGNTTGFNPGGNPTGFNIPGAQDYHVNRVSPVAATQPGATSSASSIPFVPFSAFGTGQVNIPGAASNNPYGGPVYTSTTDPKLIGQLTNTFGEGAGDSLYNFLQSGAGYNPQIAQQLLSQFQPQIASGAADIMSKFGAAGAGDSSSAGVALGSYEAQMANYENSALAQLYQQGSQNYMNLLEGVSGIGGGQSNIGGSQSSTSGTLSSILGGISKGAGTLSVAGVGGSTGTLATILSVLGGL